MKTLVFLAACGICADASWNFKLPKCPNTSDSNACVSREVGQDIADGWFSKDYLVDGAMMSIAVKDLSIRWSCAGSDPTRSFAPHFEVTSMQNTVELIDCNYPLKKTFESLLQNLKLHSSVKTLTIKNQPKNIQWPTIDEQKIIDENMHKKWIAHVPYEIYPKNSLDKLSLQGIPMTLHQLRSLQNIKTLILKDTGLTKVMNLSEFKKLHRLELYEPTLEDAELLNTSTALNELVLHAPDAGLASMPFLRHATFIEVYVIGSVFGKCKYLKTLTINGGDLDLIPDNWLTGCTQLWQLTLIHLNLRFLPYDLLSDTIGLQEVDLSHNKLESLPEGLFSKTAKLKMLNLQHNLLKKLPIDLLPGPKDLKQLCVSHNNAELYTQLQMLSANETPQCLHFGDCYHDKP